MQVKFNGIEIDLSNKELAILRTLMKGYDMKTSEIAEQVNSTPRSVSVMIHHLRRKIGFDMIKSLYRGYTWGGGPAVLTYEQMVVEVA